DPDRPRRPHASGHDLGVHHRARRVLGPGRRSRDARAAPDGDPRRPGAALFGHGPRRRRREGVTGMGTVRTLDVEGYIAAPVLPLRGDGAIDLDGMDRYVRWIADDSPKALVVNSSAGEGELLYPEERAQVLDRVVAAVGSRLPVLAGIVSEF